MYDDNIVCNIVRRIGVYGTRRKQGETWTKELNLVSWNCAEPKYDIREWNADHSKMSRGVTFTAEEFEKLAAILQEWEGGEM